MQTGITTQLLRNTQITEKFNQIGILRAFSKSIHTRHIFVIRGF